MDVYREMSYMVMNKLFYGIRPITNTRKLAAFYYGGTPLGPLSSHLFTDCEKNNSLMVAPIIDKSLLVLTPKMGGRVAQESNELLLKERVNKPKSRWLPPDTLFWSLFIAVHGESEFLQIGSKYANREWEEKNLIRQELAKNPKAVQTTNHKVTLKNVQEMMSEYMTGVCVTSLLGLVGFSVYYKIPIHLVDPKKKTHLSFLPMNTDKEACFLILRERRYELSSEPIPLDDSFGLESYTRPLRAISTYKRPELEAIKHRFNINVSGDLPKDALFRALSEHLVWK
jgi:hypothetical protein